MSRISSPLENGAQLSPEERARLSRENRGPMALGVVMGFYGLSVVLVGTRIYVRTRMSKQVRLDDWVLLGSEVVCSVCVVFVYYQIHFGDGSHFITLTVDDIDRIAKMNFGALICWTISITTTKVSILLQYTRWIQFRKTTYFIWALMVIVVLSGIATLVVVLTACIPLEAIWNADIRPRAKCLDQRLYWQIQSAFEAATCWVMLGLLIPPLWKLQLPTKKKIGIIALLGLSSSSCIASLLRLKSAFDAIPKSANEVHDFTWTGIFTTLYALLELLTGICCCSLPALMPLRYRLLPCFCKKEQPRVPLAPVIPPPPQREKVPVARPLLPTCSWGPVEPTAPAAEGHVLEDDMISTLELSCHSMAPGSIGSTPSGSSSSTRSSNGSQKALSAGPSFVGMPVITERDVEETP